MSGLIGEQPRGIPNNLVPYISRVAIGALPELNVYGNDYDTPDGTGVRDYIHIVDTAKGHVAALKYCFEHTGFEAINLGAGIGYSVMDMLSACEKASGREMPYKIAPRRPGDIDEFYAGVEKAHKLLGWSAALTIDDMCRDEWNRQLRLNE